MSYKTFTRTWWRENTSYPNGLEPHAGRKKYWGRYQLESEARTACHNYNATHEAGKLSKKMEYEEVK